MRNNLANWIYQNYRVNAVSSDFIESPQKPSNIATSFICESVCKWWAGVGAVCGISRQLDLWAARNRLKGLVYEIATDAVLAQREGGTEVERNANCHSRLAPSSQNDRLKSARHLGPGSRTRASKDVKYHNFNTRNMVYKKHRGIPTSLVSKIFPKLD